LLYADDLVLLAYNGAGLQRLLDALQFFCRANHLTFNTKKSFYVVFGGGRPYHVLCDGAQLPVQMSSLFLGIPFSIATPNHNSIASLKHGHHSKPNAVMHAVLHRCRELCIHCAHPLQSFPLLGACLLFCFLFLYGIRAVQCM
jgi:hypothetical protein